MRSKTLDAVTTTYTYNNHDQITGESRTGYAATYTYDANGNRATRVLNGVTETYTNDNGDKLNSVTWSGGSKTYGYDAAGRTTSVVTGAGTTSLAYDYEGRVTTITYPGSSTNTFTYNGLDTRVGKVDSGGTKSFFRSGVGVTDPVLSDSAANYTPGVSERRGSTTTFSHSGVKNADLQTSTSQVSTGTRKYDAFGNMVASSGTWNGPFGYAGKFGYQEDSDSGLKLLGHRYYDSSTGRFITRDRKHDCRNWYGYGGGRNNPLAGYDLDGLGWHNPGQVYVSPDFKGEVYAIGEPGEGLPQGTIKLKGGWETNKAIDVDAIVVVMPGETTGTVYFLEGWKTHLLDAKDDGDQFIVNGDGSVGGPNVENKGHQRHWGNKQIDMYTDIDAAKHHPIDQNWGSHKGMDPRRKPGYLQTILEADWANIMAHRP